jgi:hypothetical protein
LDPKDNSNQNSGQVQKDVSDQTVKPGVSQTSVDTATTQQTGQPQVKQSAVVDQNTTQPQKPQAELKSSVQKMQQEQSSASTTSNQPSTMQSTTARDTSDQTQSQMSQKDTTMQPKSSPLGETKPVAGVQSTPSHGEVVGTMTKSADNSASKQEGEVGAQKVQSSQQSQASSLKQTEEKNKTGI